MKFAAFKVGDQNMLCAALSSETERVADSDAWFLAGARLWSSSKGSWRISPAGQELYCWGWRHHFLQGWFPVTEKYFFDFEILSFSSTLELDSRQERRMVTRRSKHAQDCASCAVTALLMNFPRSEKTTSSSSCGTFFSVQLCRYNLVTRQQDMLYEARILQKSVHSRRVVLRLKNHGESAEAEAEGAEGGPCRTRFGHRWAAAWDGPGF